MFAHVSDAVAGQDAACVACIASSSIHQPNQGKEIELSKKLQEVRATASSKHLQFCAFVKRSKMSPAARSRWSSRSRTELTKVHVMPLSLGCQRSPTRQPPTIRIKGTNLGVCAFSAMIAEAMEGIFR